MTLRGKVRVDSLFGYGEKKRVRVLRKLQVEGINFLRADVAGKQEDFAGAEAGPGRPAAERISIACDFVQITEFFKLRIADSQAKSALAPVCSVSKYTDALSGDHVM